MAFGQFATVTSEIAGDTMTVKFSDPQRSVGPVAPSFSGEQITERVRMLPGGFLELRQNGQKLLRDSRGRTRTEREMGPPHYPGVHGVFILTEITDPVKGVYYALDDQSRIAHRLILSDALLRVPDPGAPARIGVTCLSQNARSARPRCVEETFPEQNFEGVTASGWKAYSVIKSDGEADWLMVTDEEWYSRELGMTVLSRHSDPRDGEGIVRWTHMNREEPDLSMFAPPAGYRIVDEKDSFAITLKRR